MVTAWHCKRHAALPITATAKSNNTPLDCNGMTVVANNTSCTQAHQILAYLSYVPWPVLYNFVCHLHARGVRTSLQFALIALQTQIGVGTQIRMICSSPQPHHFLHGQQPSFT